MKKVTKYFSVMVTALMVLGLLPFPAFADGTYYVDSDYITLKPGETASILIAGDNAAGYVQWSGEGTITSAGDGWIDSEAGNTALINITANEVGTGYVTVYPTDIATFDGEQLENVYTIQVNVVSDEPEPVQEAAPQDVDDIMSEDLADAETAQEQPLLQAAEETPQEEAPQPQEIPQEETTTEEETDEEETTEEETTTEEQEPETQVVSGDVLTDGDHNYEDLTEEERLYTTVNEQELYIIRFPRWMDEEGNIVWNDEVSDLELLPGFELNTVNYKGMNVDTFRYKEDITAFVIKDPATDRSNYYVLKADGTGFEELSYIMANGKTYIVVDFPADFVVPDGYQMVEISLGSGKVQALKQIVDTPAPEAQPEPAAEAAPAAEEEPAPEAEIVPQNEEEIPYDDTVNDAVNGIYEPSSGKFARIIIDSRIKAMLRGYETYINPGLESADPSADLYYIYCLVDGKTQLYSYDSVEGTLQRASIVIYNEIPTEPQTVIVYQEAPTEQPIAAPETQPQATPGIEANNTGSFLQRIGWNDMQIQVKVLMIALAVAILLIIILIILFATMSRRNKKRSKKNRRNNIPPRSSGRTAPLNEDDDAFFSYVKTDENYDRSRRK